VARDVVFPLAVEGGDFEMFVRLSKFQGSMAVVDQGVSLFRDRILPETEEQPGYEGALLLVDREGGVVYSLTFWETEEALEGRRPRANELAEMAARETGTQLVEVGKCEVAVSRFPAVAA
jgi:heme-degrading monooxygenase HmoA